VRKYTNCLSYGGMNMASISLHSDIIHYIINWFLLSVKISALMEKKIKNVRVTE